MHINDNNQTRELRVEYVDVDLVVIGGGMAGTCCAITAAREGIRVALVQDRPVLGGNASSEFRLWMLGATSHMGNNNRWAREGGVVDEIMVENTFRNPEGNAIILDTILLEKVIEEPNLRLFLNTAAYEVERDGDRISCVRAFNSQNSTRYELVGKTYCDASGDGIVGFLAGAAFSMGAESKATYGELLAPAEASEDLLGHSLYFYTRDTGKPVNFYPPSYALDDITKIPRYRSFNTKEHGCQLWWIEWGGSLDTVHDTERIKWELWRIVYGIWNHIKNSGQFPEAETMTLDWVGLIPGKRESRRFLGDYVLIQQDIVEQRTHYDAVSFGGWAIDHHPVDGVYSEEEPCVQWHSKGIYQIPYRSLYSRNIENLLLAGRIISTSHIAFGSTRVMATCAHNAQVCGVAAAMCNELNVSPKALAQPDLILVLQQRLLRRGQYIPGVARRTSGDLVHEARLSASSEFQLERLSNSNEFVQLKDSMAIMLPVQTGPAPSLRFPVKSSTQTTLRVELRRSSRADGFTPDEIVEVVEIPIGHGERGKKAPNENGTGNGHGGVGSSVGVATISECRSELSVESEAVVEFHTSFDKSQCAFVCLMANPQVDVALSNDLVTGVQTLHHRMNGRVAKSSTQSPPADNGIDGFEFWTPKRRPQGRQIACTFSPPVRFGECVNVKNGIGRPTANSSNAWIAALDDSAPELKLEWDQLREIQTIELVFDTDTDHPMESVLMEHPEGPMPQCVRSFAIRGFHGELLHECRDNHQTRYNLRFEPPITTDVLTIELDHPTENTPAALLELSCFGPTKQREA